MTTTKNDSGSMTLPTSEIGFLLNLAESDGTAVSDADFDRLSSLRSIYQDRDLPKTEAAIYLLIRTPGGYDAETIVEAFTDEALADSIAHTLNAYSSECFEVRPVPLRTA